MLYDTRQWEFIEDMNYSGSVTISDVWLWVKWLYFYPGDVLFRILMIHAPDVARFFEITPDLYGGVLSFIISGFVWFLVLLFVIGIYANLQE